MMGCYCYMVSFFFYFLQFIFISHQAIPMRTSDMDVRNATRSESRYKRGTPTRYATLWTQGIVPYRKDSITTDWWISNLFDRAVTYVEERSCIKFKPVKDSAAVSALNLGHKTFLSIIKADTCGSFVGNTGSASKPVQELGLSTSCSGSIRTPVHELLHALGMKHEFKRPDRTNYLSFHEENIMANQKFQFTKLTDGRLDLSVPYDMSSVMHYQGYAFSINPNDYSKHTIYPRAPLLASNRGPDQFGGDVRGANDPMSHRDMMSLNKLYGCADHCTAALACQNGGFVNKDCVCQCPRFYTGAQCETFMTSNSKDCRTPWDINIVPGQTGTLTPPGYEGGGFRFNRTCVWRIRAPPGDRVRIAFTKMNIDRIKKWGGGRPADGECKTDKLTIYLYGSDVDFFPVRFCEPVYNEPDVRDSYYDKANPIWSYSDSEEVVVHWKSTTRWLYLDRRSYTMKERKRAWVKGWALKYQAVSQDDVPTYGVA